MAASLALGACASVFGIGDLPPLASQDGGVFEGGDDGVASQDGGVDRGDGDSAGRHDGGGAADSPGDPGSDPRWARWHLPPDDPPASEYTFTNGADGAMLTDTVTGLTWQDTISSTLRRRDDAMTYCDALVYDGMSDWRMPTRIELVSIVRFGGAIKYAPAASAFSSAPPSACYWTASVTDPNATTNYVYWYIWGGVDRADDAATCMTRCVRGGPPLGTHTRHVYTLDASTVSDSATGLIWERSPPVNELHRDDADARCKALTLQGKSARLPTMKELLSIVDDEGGSPISDPVFGNLSAPLWASTTTTIVGEGGQVDFLTGETRYNDLPASSRCVAGP